MARSSEAAPVAPAGVRVVGDPLFSAAVATVVGADPRFALIGAADAPVTLDQRRPANGLLDLPTAEVLDRLASTGPAGRTAPGPGTGTARAATLTAREQQVLDALTGGCPPDGLAEHLGISPATVRTHLQNLRAKLGVRSTLELVGVAPTPVAPSGPGWWPVGHRLPGAPGPAVVLAGRRPLELDGLARLLTTRAVACAVTADGLQEACAFARDDGGADPAGPDADRWPVVVLVGDLHDRPAVSACRKLKDADEPVRVLIVADGDGDERLLAAVEAGVDGWLDRAGTGVGELFGAIDTVARGEPVIPAHLLGALLRGLIRRRREEDEVLARFAALSARERTILRMLADGHDHAAIAEALVVSPHTARTHIQNTLRKLGVHSRAEAAALARRFGLHERFEVPGAQA